jgi:predicted transcriptional regulator of viral defense system
MWGLECGRRCGGREAEIKNEVEKIRHRACVLKKRGWLARAKDGRIMPAPAAVGRGASPASAEHPRPGAGTA